MERSCETCRYDLGGGYDNCRINLEAECAAGDYEAWEPKDDGERRETSSAPDGAHSHRGRLEMRERPRI